MDYQYVKTPDNISMSNLIENEFRLSAKSYRQLSIINKNVKPVSSLINSVPLSGLEVGSIAYVDKSDYIFLRTKAIQDINFTLDFETNGAIQHIKPIDFINKGCNNKGLVSGEILFVTGGNVGAVAIVDNDYPNIIVSSHILRLNFNENPLYIFSILKHNLAKEQANFAPEGSILGLDTFKINYLMDLEIPYPNHNKKNTIQFVELIAKAIINKEKLIIQRHKNILQLFETELVNNQKPIKYTYELPRINEIKSTERLDTSLYCKEFKYWNHLVKVYINGSIDLISRGFTCTRGTSLEKGFIGTRVDSDTYIQGFYELVLPTNISQYGFVEKTTYIGTPTKLKTIEKGDIIFGGEGFGKGRTYVVIEESSNVATNYHGIRIINNNHNVIESIFIRCFLAFWRSKGMIDYIGVGGSGGHCAPSYFHLIETPLFDETKQKQIALLYHNPESKYNSETFTLDSFLEQDNIFNETAGIYELDKTAKHLKKILDRAIDDIAHDRVVSINFA